MGLPMSCRWKSECLLPSLFRQVHREENLAGDLWPGYTERNENHLELCVCVCVCVLFFFKVKVNINTAYKYTTLSTLIWGKKVNGVFSAKGVFSYTVTVGQHRTWTPALWKKAQFEPSTPAPPFTTEALRHQQRKRTNLVHCRILQKWETKLVCYAPWCDLGRCYESKCLILC